MVLHNAHGELRAHTAPYREAQRKHRIRIGQKRRGLQDKCGCTVPQIPRQTNVSAGITRCALRQNIESISGTNAGKLDSTVLRKAN